MSTHLRALRFVASFRSPLILILIICLVTGIPHDVFAAAWTRQTVPTNSFKGLAASADDQIMVMGGDDADFDQGIYMSFDGGATWEERLTAADSGNEPWAAFAISADGDEVVGVQDGGYIWVSNNSGESWFQEGENANWSDVTMTADGGYMAAVAQDQFLLAETYDGGSTWLEAGQGEAGYLTGRAWDTVSYSPNGDYLVVGAIDAAPGSGYISISTNKGHTWDVERGGPFEADWDDVAVSNDGKILAGGNGVNLYVSPDGGTTWNDGHRGDGAWGQVAIAADDTDTMIAASDGGYVYLSTNGGATWQFEGHPPGNLGWNGAVLSADGTLAAVSGGGTQFFTYDVNGIPSSPPAAPSNLVATPGDGQITVSWDTPDDHGSPITEYLIEYKLDTEGDDAWVVPDPIIGNETTITGLTNGLLYDFYLVAINDAGQGDVSDLLTGTPAVPPVVHHHSGGGGGSIQEQVHNLAASGNQAGADAVAAQWPSIYGTTTPSGVAAGTLIIVRDLTVGMTGDDVKALQTLLITQNTGAAAKALATIGATGLFGSYTQRALAEYQKAHSIVPAVGYFGAITRAEMKAAGIAGLWW